MTDEEKMTPEEAIAEISFLKVAVNKVMEQALDMAIQALSQEPTEKPMTVDEMEREYEKSKALFHKIVECEDAISRQAVLSKIKEVCFSEEWTQFRLDNGSNGQRDFLINYIEQLPPVTRYL